MRHEKVPYPPHTFRRLSPSSFSYIALRNRGISARYIPRMSPFTYPMHSTFADLSFLLCSFFAFFSIILSRRDATSRDETWFRLPSDFFATGEERVTHCLSYDQVWREERFIYFPEFSRNAYRVYEAVRGNRALCCASCRSFKKKRRKRTQYA